MARAGTTSVKKASPKKESPKKVSAKKAVAKKEVTKPTAVKKAPAKKPVVKKAVVKKVAAKKVAAKVVAKKVSPKKASTDAILSTNTLFPKTTSNLLNRDWSWLLGLGILFVIFGFLGLSSVVGVTLISIVFVGFMFLIGGILQLVDVSRSRQWKPALWHGLIALMYFLGGCFIIWDPVLASTLITALLGWTLVVIGIFRLPMAISLHGHKGWVFMLISSLIALGLGCIILMQWPLSSLWVIGLFISIELLVNGLSYMIIAIAKRNHLK